jgi:hypothetical protein
MSLNIIKLLNKRWYLSNEVHVIDPAFFPGCHINLRLIIEKKNLKSDNYMFAYIKNNVWIESTDKYARSKLLLSSDWVENNVPKIIVMMKKKSLTNNNIIESELNDECNDININKLYDVEPAPHVLTLEDHEKFRNNDGKTFEIEVRGSRNHKESFFKVKDVMEAFQLPYLNDILTHKDKGYVYYKHYKYFTINLTTPGEKIKTKKEMFLTYIGVLKVLFSSRTGNAENFQNWASEILFTVQMGTKENKLKLCSNILGVDAKVIKEVFNTGTHTLPCVYLFTLGTVNSLKKSMNLSQDLDNNSIICKFGLTKNLSRRTAEHLTNFEKISNCDLKLKYYSYVDPLYITNAENDIKLLIKSLNINVKYDNYNELIILNKDLFSIVQNYYDQIGKKYAGHISELISKIKDLEHELDKQNIEKEKLVLEISKQNIEKENIKLKYELYKLKNNHEEIIIKNESYLLDNNYVFKNNYGMKGELYGVYNSTTNTVKKIKI